MSAKLLDGKAVAEQIKTELAQRVKQLKVRGITPGLGTIVVGDDPASKIYVNGKHADCAEIGVNSMRIELPESASMADIYSAIDSFNTSPACTGFIVQLPLPASIDTNLVLERIDPQKDADGLHPTNLGRLVLNTQGELVSSAPCTPRGIIELGRRYGINWDGANVCVVGQGRTVGRPLALLLARSDVNATVDCCHVGTVDLRAHTLQADIVVVATGVANLLTADMIKPGAVVFDVGVTRVPTEMGGTAILGDVDTSVRDVAGWISPNPGGVGPMTRAMLLANIVDAAQKLEE